mgnify:CR=1 FL=1
MSDWDLDFSHDLLKTLVDAVRRERRLELLGDAERALASGDAVAFLRHDVDVSLARARVMADLEREWGVRSTYHVMWRSPFYDPASAAGRADLAAIAAAGHEVGLHFFAPEGAGAPVELEAAIRAECERLEDLLGTPVRSLSFHIPPPSMMRGPLRVAGRINAYAAELFEWYLSDSAGRWREGDPRESLTRPRSRVLQLLVHPIWWGEQHARPADRLGEWVDEIARATGRSFEDVAEETWKHIIYRAEKPRRERSSGA